MNTRHFNSFTNRKGEQVNIDILPSSGDNPYRVRMVVKRGDDMAMYSDYFGSEEAAVKWAQDIVVAYGEFDRDAHLCDRCGSAIWPWDARGGEQNEDDPHPYQYHLSCWHDELTYCSLCEGTNGNHVTVDIRFLETSDGTSTLNTWRDDRSKGRTNLTYAAWVRAHQPFSADDHEAKIASAREFGGVE